MKIKTMYNGKIYFCIQYENDEWLELEKLLQTLGLVKATTTNAWGEKIQLEFYREKNEELRKYLLNTFSFDFYFCDDINTPFYRNSTLNIAIFRVVPNHQKLVQAPLQKFLILDELYTIASKIKKIYEILYNISVEREIEIKKTILEVKV